MKHTIGVLNPFVINLGLLELYLSFVNYSGSKQKLIFLEELKHFVRRVNN